MLKVKQQKLALRVALYVLRANGWEMPKKKHVLNFIRIKNLLSFPEHELNRRSLGAIDEIWANDICWKRKDLYEDGEIDSPERGRWRLTQTGLRMVREKKPIWIQIEKAEIREELGRRLDYCTDQLLDWMLKIARDEDLSLTDAKERRSCATD